MTHKEELMKLVVKSDSQSQNRNSGGQSCGIIARDVILELDGQIKIEISCFRSMLENKVLAYTLMELAIDELLNKTSK